MASSQYCSISFFSYYIVIARCSVLLYILMTDELVSYILFDSILGILLEVEVLMG